MLTRDRAIQVLRENQDYLRDEFVEFSRPIGFRFMDLAEYLEDLLGRKVDLLTPAGVEAIRSQHVSKDIAAGVAYV